MAYGGLEKDGRAYHQKATTFEGDRDRSFVLLAKEDSVGTAIHEWGHVIEHQHPSIGTAAWAFLRKRVGEEPTVALTEVCPECKYESHERGRKDNFEAAFGSHAHYVGKDYGGRATEIMSMGLEKLYKDPVTFAKKDPEYFNFVVDILHGKIP